MKVRNKCSKTKYVALKFVKNDISKMFQLTFIFFFSLSLSNAQKDVICQTTKLCSSWDVNKNNCLCTFMFFGVYSKRYVFFPSIFCCVCWNFLEQLFPLAGIKTLTLWCSWILSLLSSSLFGFLCHSQCKQKLWVLGFSKTNGRKALASS